MLGTLIGGRIGIPRSALAAAKSGLTIAIKYSDQRRQFGPEGGLEVPILNYRIHQRRLLPARKDICNSFCITIRYESFHLKKESEMIEALAV
jgi:acyl-CoA oxidase